MKFTKARFILPSNFPREREVEGKLIVHSFFFYEISLRILAEISKIFGGSLRGKGRRKTFLEDIFLFKSYASQTMLKLTRGDSRKFDAVQNFRLSVLRNKSMTCEFVGNVLSVRVLGHPRALEESGHKG